MRILYHCTSAEGGLAEYARHQAAALSTLPNVEVLWQAPKSLAPPAGVFSLQALSISSRKAGRIKLRRALDYAFDTLAPFGDLVREVGACKPDAVLLSTWGEYFAPLWALRLRRLHRRGVKFGAVIHDPIRDNIRGPVWWHRLSVRQAYSFLDVAFTHDVSAPDTCGSQHSFRTVQIPHGPFLVPDGNVGKAALRRELGIPEHATVLFAFGHIRDGKNLDRVISALQLLPEVHLLVAGREQSGEEKPVDFYRSLAHRLGVGSRCHWNTGYIPNDEVWKYFRASDVLFLLYSKNFRSASGVLNVNTQFGLPVLASAGKGPLLDLVTSYNLGVIIDEPAPDAIYAALPRALSARGDWRKFAEDNSWHTNAKRVADALAECLAR